ncbi:MAG TPA: amidohydrolase family protein [Candidatus Lustribacter sp.]|jgi:predicted TIM-barrel fold metal-dependent hydrolase|nr:amidohydrolase family protein [Candidatus Lustribacter sp.]
MSGHAEFPGSDVRAKLDHPVVDADGHVIECEWLLDEYVREVAGPEIQARWMKRPAPYGPTKMIWWGYPSAAHTADRAMSMFPKYFAARMEACGIDFAHMLTTAGLATLYVRDDELRAAGCRALNTMYADMFRDVQDRIRPAAVIPTFTPEEAIRELEHAVLELGHKTVMVGTEIRKPYPEVFRDAPQFGQFAERWQSIAIDPPHDYDPFWRRCVELGVAPLCHTSHIGAQHRRSPSNYVFNHLGMFAGGSEHFCRALFLGGVTNRFPELNFGLLEGGVAWAVTLLNDIVEHFEKRNVTDLVESLDPGKLDVELLARLADEYGDDRITGARVRERPHSRSSDPQRPPLFDEFAASGMKEVADLGRLFCDNFYFGCEADDRMMAVGFNRKLSPVGRPLKAVFGSDIGHWDVMDAGSILSEAYSLVTAGLLAPADFTALTWTNPASLHLRTNPDYFKGTAVEADAEKLKDKMGIKISAD